MSLPDQTPKLPKLPFLVGDAALLAAAWLIYDQRRHPLDGWAIAGVVACVAVGVFLAAIPFLSDYARKQDEALDERQRGLEALSRTVNTAAEQISIAANGLHEITELAHKNLKHAEQLPQKLHEKITEFNAQLDNAREDDREELEKELAELRASETDRLQAIADKVQKAVAELTKLDAAAQKHLTARTELVARTSDAMTKAHADATVAFNEALAAVTRELATAQAKALAEIDARFADRTAAALAAIESATAAARAAIPVAPPPAPVSENPAPPLAAEITPAPEVASPLPTSAPATVASPPKRPRKSRREEPAPSAAVEPAAISPAAEIAASAPPPEAAAVATAPIAAEPPAALPPADFPEPAPIPVETIRAVQPVAPASADPFTAAAAPAATTSERPVEPPAAPPPAEPPANLTPTPPPAEVTPPPPPIERPAKKRAARKPDPEPTAALPLDLGDDQTSPATSEDSQVTSADAIERVISSDGATRLIATAYIGIGNRLFIRGDGPGLSWEKGVPLQFISIGKWRWETSDATAPIAFKLYKNDEIECAALGKLTLDPGHQQEVSAKF